ncbi:MAG: xanthine dehydrogenase family protein molybdopterin-binding subunit, partial [Gammaproteobacteria bacterium]
GRPEAIYAIERLLDVAAQELGISAYEIRKINFIKPQQMPYQTALGSTYDSGDFLANLDDAVRLADLSAFESRRAAALLQNKLRGIGLATYIERCGGGAPETARLEVAADGHVTLYIGTQSNGQGHETAFRQILCDRLGVEPGDITLVQGDSDRVATGGGTGGSRSVPVGGAALSGCAFKLIEKARRRAADLLEAAVADVEFKGGEFRIVGTDRQMTFKEVALQSAPADGGPSFDEQDSFAPAEATYPNGTHVCELEIDRDTGVLQILNYVVVDDFGKTINPKLVAGQVHGGIVQGLGQALTELASYETESGQLGVATFMDYAMPRADNLCNIEFELNEVPCTTNPLGIKGAGEAGAIGAPPAIINAIVDALQPLGVRHLDMPATAEKLWRIMRQAEAA